jgi:hypothetical protein
MLCEVVPERGGGGHKRNIGIRTARASMKNRCYVKWCQREGTLRKLDRFANCSSELSSIYLITLKCNCIPTSEYKEIYTRLPLTVPSVRTRYEDELGTVARRSERSHSPEVNYRDQIQGASGWHLLVSFASYSIRYIENITTERNSNEFLSSRYLRICFYSSSPQYPFCFVPSPAVVHDENLGRQSVILDRDYLARR